MLDNANISEKVSNVKDIISSVGGDLTGNFDIKRQLYNTLKGLSEEQVKAALTSGQFDKQTAKVLLRLKGYNKETVKAMLSTGNFADKVSDGITPLKNLGKAAGEFGKQLLSGLKQLGLFLATNPIGWIIDAAAVVAILAAVYKKFNISAEEANKNLKNAFDESKNQLKSVKEQKDTVDQLAESYEKLSKGVNTATNENISLSTDSYKEYLDTCNQIADLYPDLVTGYDAQGNAILSLKGNVDQLTESYEKLSKGVNTATNENLTLSTDDYKEYLDTCNQIADMYPELVSGYDAQGNAILSLKGNVQGLTDAYKEAQQEAYKTAFVGVTDDDGKTSGGISDVEKQFSYATNGYDPGDNWWNRAKLTTNRRIEQLKELQDMSLEEIKQSGYTYSEALKDSGININDLLTATEDQLPEYKAKINDFTQTIIQTQEDAVSNAKSSLEGYMKGITDASGSALASGYDKLTEEQQNFATSLLSSLDLDTLQAFENSGDFEGAAKKWVDNLVSSVSNMSATAKSAYDKLQDSIANPDNLTSTAIENIDGYLDTLESELNISKDKLKEIFNLKDIFDTQTSFDNIVKQYLGTDEFDKLSSGVKKAADSVDEYGNAVKEAGKSSAELFASQQAHPNLKPSILYLRDLSIPKYPSF